ncbi:asparagine synthase (glutamine-hydrolyzing) [Novosphingobium hassiacum]|uniref:asparagine synthase (glutamine-hydrolyzing) n=1 Tax=Novosphingobium hassiacum TaxID=173676 RepID=A0A7W5ZX47_9SPHN|nr:asparagine synthase C-terminal domain-containing protein [Novosphingobium hassiacum]MBB3860874.1 asparagine synthase (glutamine-hydrolyzing) [Novosphingobium hassiacum]
MIPVQAIFSLPLTKDRAVGAIISRVDDRTQLGERAPSLWVASESHILTLGDRGLLIGIYFAGKGQRAMDRIALPKSAMPAEDIARWLVREGWGAYVAILRDPETGDWSVLRDPSGLLPLYRMTGEDRTVFGTDPRLFEAVTGKSPQVCWKQIGTHLRRPELRQRKTCLVDIAEVEPGTLTSASDPEVSRLIWDPADFVRDAGITSFSEAVAQLRETACDVTGAWAALAGHVVVAASGGVDSSIIAAALSVNGQSFECVTLATADPSGDERAWVQLLAEKLAVPMTACTYDVGRIDLAGPVSATMTRPSGKAFMQEVRHHLARTCETGGASWAFDGNGGDNLFCFVHSAAPVLDRLKHDGLSSRTWATFLDMCQLTGADAGTMARAVARRWKRGEAAAPWPSDFRLLDTAFPLHDDAALTPWFDVATGQQPGKRDHLRLLQRTQNFVHGIDDPLRFSPLLSQPMLELCLSIPTWLWCSGGINRAPSRKAFAPELPVSLARRTSKAGPDSVMREVFARDRSVIRTILLDGQLAANGVIDRVATETALAADPHAEDPIVYRLLDLVEAEAWARSWG